MEENNISLVSFSDNMQIDKNLGEEDRMLIELKMWNLLSKHTERYTMGDSTSVPIEVAEELLNSICFSIGLELQGLNNPKEVLLCEDVSHLLKAAWRKIDSMIEVGKRLLEEVKENSPYIENISYN
ncbi:DUF6179 domain-containing protein, partial [Clostridium perfringens]